VRMWDIPAETTVRETAKPVFLRGTGPSALLLHGFTGTPREMGALGVRLNTEGFTVSIPRLPGHGTNAGDFLNTGWRDWLRAATDAYLELRTLGAPVYLAGLSMGGLLAVMLASRFPVKRLALAAPALRTRNPLLLLTPVLAALVRRIPVPRPEGFIDEDDRFMAAEYWRWRFPGPLAELLRLQRMAVRALPGVRADTLTLIGSEDRTVPASVLRLIQARAGARSTRGCVLPGAGHRIFREEPQACAEIVHWFTERQSKGES
jgi:carboxylesterase